MKEAIKDLASFGEQFRRSFHASMVGSSREVSIELSSVGTISVMAWICNYEL